VDRHGREEVAQVAVDDDGGADVRRGVGEDAAAGDEAVGGVVRRQLRQDVVEHPALGRGELSVRGAQRPLAAALLRHQEVDVVRER